MVETTFLLIRKKSGRVSVEMTKANGRRQIIPDFRDEAEASAWIIQIERQIANVHPHEFGSKKRV
jgi:hypothetical protein